MLAILTQQLTIMILANVNVLHAVARLSVCRLSVTLVHPTQAVVIFGNFSRAFSTLATRPLTSTENFTEIPLPLRRGS